MRYQGMYSSIMIYSQKPAFILSNHTFFPSPQSNCIKRDVLLMECSTFCKHQFSYLPSSNLCKTDFALLYDSPYTLSTLKNFVRNKVFHHQSNILECSHAIVERATYQMMSVRMRAQECLFQHV